MKIGDLVQHKLSPVVGVITKIHIDWQVAAVKSSVAQPPESEQLFAVSQMP